MGHIGQRIDRKRWDEDGFAGENKLDDITLVGRTEVFDSYGNVIIQLQNVMKDYQ